jgi:hypothetical protein
MIKMKTRENPSTRSMRFVPQHILSERILWPCSLVTTVFYSENPTSDAETYPGLQSKRSSHARFPASAASAFNAIDGYVDNCATRVSAYGSRIAPVAADRLGWTQGRSVARVDECGKQNWR